MSLSRTLLCVSALALPSLLGGCVVAAIGGVAAAGAAGGYTAAQERGIGGSLDDLSVKDRIQGALTMANPPLDASVEVTVYEGRALLTGAAQTPESRARAEQLARQTPGVRTLYDEVEIGPGQGTWDAAQDAWITTRLRSDLVLDDRIRSVNYTIETANHSVYLMGSARSQSELDLATNTARNLPGVKRVVSYVEIRPGAPVAALPEPASPQPPGMQGANPPMAAPVTAVEAKRL
jgi:osmotically-inducible protein OsmY